MDGSDPVDVIVAAAGSGRRLGDDRPKAFVEIGGAAMLSWTLRIAARLQARRLVVTVPAAGPGSLSDLFEAAAEGVPLQFITGGVTRQESVYAGLKALHDGGTGDGHLVLIHDAARPCASLDLWRRVVSAAAEVGAAIPVLAASDSLKRVDSDGTVAETLDRARIVHAQTPQGFRFGPLWEAHQQAAAAGETATDDAALVERTGQRVATVDGETTNIKVTTPEDIPVASRLLGGEPVAFRVGQGYDIHPLVEGRRLILGGVEIEHPSGLSGHSDADALAHAVTDALLGAAGMGDIGLRFPADDPQWEGADSLELLATVVDELAAAGYRPTNVDATILAEEPRLAPHLVEMRERLAARLGLPTSAVNVKATRGEGLGSIGKGEGIAVHAVAVVTGT